MEQTAQEIIFNLPSRLKPGISLEEKFCIHLQLEGEGGGKYTITVAEATCRVEEGFAGEPDCEVSTKAKTFAGIQTGKINPTMAFMSGKIKVSNIPVMMKFIQFFDRQA